LFTSSSLLSWALNGLLCFTYLRSVPTASGRAASGRSFAPPGEQVVDSTGAGDFFLAGFLAELLHKGGLKKLANPSTVPSCAEFGAAVAAALSATTRASDVSASPAHWNPHSALLWTVCNGIRSGAGCRARSFGWRVRRKDERRRLRFGQEASQDRLRVKPRAGFVVEQHQPWM
jgi:pfkB family carbohydrate kinase